MEFEHLATRGKQRVMKVDFDPTRAEDKTDGVTQQNKKKREEEAFLCFWWRRKIEVSMNWKIESSFIESRLESSSLAPWVPRGDVFSRRKASFSEHERLGVFEILGLDDKRGHVQEKHDSVLALCSGERIAQVPRNERKRMSREGN